MKFQYRIIDKSARSNSGGKKIRRGFTAVALSIAATAIVTTFITASNQTYAAGTESWSGADRNDSNWTSNGNWTGIGGGGPNDDLVFPAGAARLTNFNDFPTNTNFNTLRFTGRGYVISGNQIFLDDGLSINIPAGTGKREK